MRSTFWQQLAERLDPALATPQLEPGYEVRRLSTSGGGEYFEIGQDLDRDVASKIILNVKRRAKVTHEVQRYEDLYWQCLFAAGTLLCLGTILIKRSTELWWQAAAAIVAVALLANAVR